MSDKPKFPRAVALAVAKELCDGLKPDCIKLIVAGSMRRRKPLVGDVEILFIPRLVKVPDGLFDLKDADATEDTINQWLERGILDKRASADGRTAWGKLNKLAVHCASGVPVDLFTATESNWFNYLVCRTGPADSNTRIASKALTMGWHWNPYGEGFSKFGRGESRRMESERAVFEFVGLPYAEPWERK